MSHPLSSVVAGPVLTPEDDGYAAEVATFNLSVQHRPDVVVGATSTQDVAATVRWAREAGVPVRAFGAGHSGPPAAGGVLVSTRRLDGVEIDPATHVATLGAGVRWGAVVPAAAAHGLAPVAGSSPTVGVVGFLLGGGIGPFVRSHGFGSDHLVGATVVTGAGEVLEDDADLLWALRGGKYVPGVVTQVRVELARIDELYAGTLLFDGEHGDAVLRGWLDWTASADDLTTSAAAVVRMPPLEVVPELLRGRTVVALRFVRPGSVVEGELAAAPLRALAPVLLDGLGPLPLDGVASIWQDPTEPVPGWSSGVVVGSAGDGFADAWIEHVGPGAGDAPFVGAELRFVGPRTSPWPDGDAVAGRQAQYVVGLVTAGPPPYDAAAAAGRRLLDALGPWLHEDVNPNFAGALRSAHWPEATAVRLAEVRRRHDPDGLLTGR